MTDYTDLKARLGMLHFDIERPTIAEALAAIEELEARNQWQPIETAPKDGTVIYVWHVATINRHAAFDVNIKKAQWITEAEEWRVENVGGNVPTNPTHWMPLPQPPEQDQ